MDKVRFEELNFYQLQDVQNKVCMRGNQFDICANYDPDCFCDCSKYSQILNGEIYYEYEKVLG